MSDPAGTAFGALLSAASHHHDIQDPAPSQEGELKVVRLRMRRPPETLDLACHETLPPDLPPAIQPLAPSVVYVPPPPAFCCKGFKFDDAAIDSLYWEKHLVLTKMMGGFAHTIADQLQKCERGPGRVQDHADLLHAVVNEKRARGRAAKLKTIADHHRIDKLFHLVCRMHTKVIEHGARGLFKSQQTSV